MEEKGCCCLSLHVAAGFGLLWTVTKSIFGMATNGCLIELMSQTTTGIIRYPIRLSIVTDSSEDFDIIGRILLAAFGLNALWFMCGILAFLGNMIERRGCLTPWLCSTYLITVFEFGTSVYFGLKLQDHYYEAPELHRDGEPTIKLTYLTLLTIFSGGGFILLLNFYIAHIVEKRVMEIDRDYYTRMFRILSRMKHRSRTKGDVKQYLLPEAPPSYYELHPREYNQTTDMKQTNQTLSSEKLKNERNEHLDEFNTACDVKNVEANDSEATILLLNDHCKDY